jgi:hypothetical protein
LRIHTTNDRFGTRLSLECRVRPRGLAGLVWPPVAAAPQGSSHSTQLDNHCVHGLAVRPIVDTHEACRRAAQLRCRHGIDF